METNRSIQKFTSSISFKLILIGIISLVLLIPSAWITSLISEREERNREVKNEIAAVWGGNQSIAGPILTVPYKIRAMEKGEESMEIQWAHFMPEELHVEAELFPQERHRGIFKVIVYESAIQIKSEFGQLDFNKFQFKPTHILWDEARVGFFVPENKYIRNQPIFTYNGKELEIIPGNENLQLLGGGFNAPVKLNPAKEAGTVKLQIHLDGSERFSVYPTARETRVKVSGKWSGPSFNGAILPTKSSVNDESFSAEWNTSYLNRNYPQQWTNDHITINGSDFGVELLTSIDHYQKSVRSVKYSLMFIFLTFMVFILIEILNNKRLHPVQYFLTGLALVVFYILLVSLAEQIGFNPAYVISSVSVIFLISYYTWTAFKSKKITFISMGLLAVLYVFLFVVLQLQDYALLIGSIGIFASLASFMILTRNYKWYKEE